MKRLFVRSRLIAFSLLALLSSGCDRYIESSDPVRTLPDYEIVPQDLRLSLGNNSITVSWTVPSMDGIKNFRIYLYDSTFVPDSSGFEPINRYETSARQITIDSLIPNRIYKIQASAVFQGGLEGDRSAVVQVRPSYFSMRLNGGDKYTNSTSLNVHINSPLQTTHMLLSEDSLFADASLVPFEANSLFNVLDGDGEKHLYARLVFIDGSETAEIIDDNIILDTDIQIGSVSFLGPATVQAGDTVTFVIIGFETEGVGYVSFGSVLDVALNDYGQNGDAAPLDGIYSAWYAVPEGISMKNAVVTGKFVDRAGNVETKEATTNLTIEEYPAPVALSVSLQSDSLVLLSWTESAASDFAYYKVHRVSPNTADIAIINNRTTTQHTVFLPGNLLYEFQVVIINQAGFESPSNTVDVQGPGGP